MENSEWIIEGEPYKQTKESCFGGQYDKKVVKAQCRYCAATAILNYKRNGRLSRCACRGPYHDIAPNDTIGSWVAITAPQKVATDTRYYFRFRAKCTVCNAERIIDCKELRRYGIPRCADCRKNTTTNSKCAACNTNDRYTNDAGLARAYCIDCLRKSGRASYARNRKLLNPNEFNEQLANQDFKCLLCGEPFNNDRWSERPAVDHCHKTNNIRGIIHHRCNLAIGFLRDSPERAIKAAEYLTKTAQAA